MSKLFKISFAVLTACLTIGSLSSFRNLDATIWHYNGSPLLEAEYNDINKWQEQPVSGVTCGSNQDIPCQTTEEMTQDELEDFLENNTGTALFSKVSKRN